MPFDRDLFTQWTPIAMRRRSAIAGSELTWTEIDPGTMTIRQAHRLAEQGRLWIANRHTETHVELVVRRRLTPPAIEQDADR